MTIGVLATVTVAEGQGETFETLFAAQAAKVRANEPANRLYQLLRSRKTPGVYVVMEIYDDDAALDAHRASAHMAEGRPKIGPLLAGPTQVEVLDAV
ncbi:MAG TPA: putative quinol monooxygenase [Caulobacteraceae bacterium]|nr:putative quinol monooxygenase [Caulobacteraceae bacterium]